MGAHEVGEALVAERQGDDDQIGDVLQAEAIADAILYAVSRAPHVSINEILIRPTGQTR